MTSSIMSEESKGEIESISPEIQPEILPPQNTDTHSVNVEVENPVPDREQPTKPPSIQNRRGSFITCYMRIPKPLYYVMFCLLCVCFAPVAYALITVFTAAILPVLLVTFIVLRLFQFVVVDESYEKHFLVKVLLRYWIFVVVMLLLVEVGLFYPIAKNVSGLKLVMIIGLSIDKWIKVICILIGIYLLSQFFWFVLSVILTEVFSEVDEIRIFIILESTSEIIGCLLLLWAEVVVTSSVPTFEQSKIFGIYTRNWIKVSVFVLIGHNIIKLLANILVWSLPKIGDYLEVGEHIDSELSEVFCACVSEDVFNKKNIGYVAIGIKRSIIFILSTAMLLITWMTYFGNRLDTTPRNKRILEIGTWTFISLLICSFLWLFKSCILMYWEAHTVYDRLHSKIRDIGKHLYFLIMLSYMHYNVTVNNRVKYSKDSDCDLSCFKTSPKKLAPWILPDNSLVGYTYQCLDRRSVRTDFINRTGKNASIYDIQKAAQRFLTAQNALSNETTVGDLRHLQSNEPEESNAKCIKALKTVVQVQGDTHFNADWGMLLTLLPDVHTTEDITFDKVKTFMERAHSRCMFLTNTLISENEVVKCLNQAMSGIIIAVTFIMWLLLSGLATTQVLVLIVSPLLAGTFIFGETAKNLFQGLIFVYIAHPFDVGDLCLIDENLVEVNRIGIWSTIFSNVRSIGEQQHIIYPNSVLALKNIINYKTNFNWNDHIEFLCSPDKKITEPLILKIRTYLNDAKENFIPNFHSVEILEIGEKAKIFVHVKYKLPTTEGWTHFECLKEKEKRRLEFAMCVQNLLKQLESETKTAEPEPEPEPEPAEME